jgi:acyl carrier protein
LTGKPLEDRELRDETRWRRVLQSNRGDPPAVETTLWCGPGCPPQTFASSGEQDAGDGAWAIAELWCRGFEVDWRGLGSAEVPGLTSSALYPFSGTEHRLPPPMELQEAAAMPPRTAPARRRLPRPSLASPYRAPVTPPATRIVELIEEVLETAPVGMDDGFLELGGDSLAALQLGSRLEKVFGFDLDIAAILDNPSPEALLAHLVELMAAAYRTESRAGLPKAAEAQEVRQ